MVNVINSSILNNFTTVQELSRTPESTQGQQNAFQVTWTLPVLTTNLRRVLCVHRHLATSLQNQCSHLTSKARTRVSARIYQVRAFQKSFCESIKDERIYVFQIQIRSNNFISKFNPNPKSDSF